MPVATRPHPLLLSSFAALDGAGIRWVLLRGAEELADPVGDVDLLVHPDDWPTARRTLSAHGFLQLPAPGHGPHRFGFAFDAEQDRWLKLDVVVGLAFGPFQELRTTWHETVLGRRMREGGVWRPAPPDEDELLVLHGLLDKTPPRADAAAVRRLSLRDPTSPTGLLPALDRVVTRLRAGEPPSSCARDLRAHWQGAGPALLRTTNRIRRRLHGGRRWQWGAGATAALLGPDGAGKSTLARGLVQSLPVHAVAIHLGLWRITRWSAAVTTVPLGRTAVGLGRAVRVSTAARFHAARGRLAILDRSALDTMLGDADRSAGGRLVAGVFRRLAPCPGLVVVLDAPGEVMHARKGEHTPEALEHRRQDYLDLAAALPQAVVLDATDDVDTLRRAATSAVWAHLCRQRG